MIEIYFDEDTELSEFTYFNKDYRFGVVVVSNDKKFKLNIYGITRLNQEFQECLENKEIFYIEPNLVIVNDVTKSSIISSIVEICTNYNFLSQLKYEDTLDLSNYVKVY